jgi:hypothetical protein
LLITKRDGDRILEDTVFGTPYGVAYEGGYGGIARPTPRDLKKYLLGEDRFHVESFDMDIDFAIGDKVVTADWENPVNMLSTKIIQGFKFEEDSGDISFVLGDKKGDMHLVPYVDGKRGNIAVGRVRKITNKFADLVAGTKIQANVAGISHFPKKDTNIIIGFVTDTSGEPLVLCSNCCTQWYRDVIENFDHISIKSPQWAKSQHAPIDVAKIKYQAGDVIIGSGVSDMKNSSGWLLFKRYGASSLKGMDLRYYTQWPDYFSLDRYITANSRFDCIINPRLSPKTQLELNLKPAWPNFHGYFYGCDRAKFQFLDDERSFIDVQSSTE